MSRAAHGLPAVGTRRQAGAEDAGSVYRYTRRYRDTTTVRTPCQAREEDAASINSWSVSLRTVDCQPSQLSNGWSHKPLNLSKLHTQVDSNRQAIHRAKYAP